MGVYYTGSEFFGGINDVKTVILKFKIFNGAWKGFEEGVYRVVYGLRDF